VSIMENLAETDANVSAKSPKQRTWETCAELWRDIPTLTTLDKESGEWLSSLEIEDKIDFLGDTLHDMKKWAKQGDMGERLADSSLHTYSHRKGGAIRCLRKEQLRDAQTVPERRVDYIVEYYSPHMQDIEAVTGYNSLIHLLEEVFDYHRAVFRTIDGLTLDRDLSKKGEAWIGRRGAQFGLIVRENKKKRGNSAPKIRKVTRPPEPTAPLTYFSFTKQGHKFEVEEVGQMWQMTMDGRKMFTCCTRERGADWRRAIEESSAG
jgi:hypothetical protein